MTRNRRSTCPVACALDLVGDRWTLVVLRDLLLGKRYFDELLAAPERIATNVLSDRLKRLHEYGFVEVAVDPENARRKRYTPTELGRSFAPVLRELARWGLRHIEGTRPAPEVRAALARARRARRGCITR